MKDAVLNLLAGAFVIGVAAFAVVAAWSAWTSVGTTEGWRAFGNGVLGVFYTAIAVGVTLGAGHDSREVARRHREENR